MYRSKLWCPKCKHKKMPFFLWYQRYPCYNPCNCMYMKKGHFLGSHSGGNIDTWVVCQNWCHDKKLSSCQKFKKFIKNFTKFKKFYEKIYKKFSKNWSKFDNNFLVQNLPFFTKFLKFIHIPPKPIFQKIVCG